MNFHLILSLLSVSFTLQSCEILDKISAPALKVVALSLMINFGQDRRAQKRLNKLRNVSALKSSANSLCCYDIAV